MSDSESGSDQLEQLFRIQLEFYVKESTSQQNRSAHSTCRHCNHKLTDKCHSAFFEVCWGVVVVEIHYPLALNTCKMFPWS